MNRLKNVFSFYIVFGLMITGFLATTVNAQLYRNEREIREIVRTLNSKIDDFQTNLSGEVRRSSSSREDRQNLEDQMRIFEFKVRDFEVNFDRQSENADDVLKILEEAKKADDIVKRMSFSERSYNFWTDIRYQLDRLAANYNVSFDWKNGTSRTSSNNQRYPNNNRQNRGNNPPVINRNSNSYGLTGTYQLDVSRSENSDVIADRAINNNDINSDANRQDLEDKLEAPEQLAIDVRGNQVTLASSKASPVSLTANGQDRTENINGRTVRLRATMRGDELVISSLGGETDYTITFTSTGNGRGLKVTRRITTDYLRQTVFAESVYNKTDEVAKLGIDTGNYSDNNDGTYSSNDPNDYPNTNNPNNPPRTTYPRTGDFIVPNGTIMTGVLDKEINTKASQNNDRFTMTVQSPNEFRGAVIEGHLSGIDRSGKVSGRSEVTFNFDRIRLRNGKTYDFAGFLQNITDQDGKTVRVGTEGDAKSDSQTKETVKRGGIGAGIGAIIGAIAGGGKGAAIGAIIGGGAGAGSVILTGKEDLELGQGSTITVQSSSPIR
ncbi:hypothetical protein BH20ACI4_BH20ACI4_05600 [soil metagenome]